MNSAPDSYPSEITPGELNAWRHEGRNVQIVDVRSPGEFAIAHIAKAMLLPLAQVRRFSWIPDRDRILVCICQSGKRSAVARDRLVAMGWKNVTSVKDGMNGWIAAGLTVEKDADAPWELERQVRLIAGGVVVISVVLGWLLHPGFSAPAGIVGFGLFVSGATNWCGLAQLLARAPWNRHHF